MTRSALIAHVRAALNDMQPFDEAAVAESVNMPEKPVKSYVDEAIDLCMENMLMVAPVNFLALTSLTLTASNVQAVSAGSKKYAVVTLPSGYLRFGSLFLAGWSRSVEALGDERGRQRQYFRCTMTTNRKPCVYEDFGGSKKTLDAFPYNGSVTDSSLKYVKEYDWTLSDVDGSGTDKYISNRLAEALIYSIAFKVATYFGKEASALAALYVQAMSAAAAATGELSPDITHKLDGK
jgi:hypothetical protein